jgi:hypothetical protein
MLNAQQDAFAYNKASLYARNLAGLDLGSNPCLRSRKPATQRLNYEWPHPLPTAGSYKRSWLLFVLQSPPLLY